MSRNQKRGQPGNPGQFAPDKRGKDQVPTPMFRGPFLDETPGGDARTSDFHEQYLAVLRARNSESDRYPDVEEAAVVGDALVRVLQSGGKEDPNWDPEEPDREVIIRYAMTEQGRADCEFAISTVSSGIALHEGRAEAEPEKAELHMRRAQATRNVVGVLRRLLTSADERVNTDRAERGLVPLPHPAGATGVQIGNGFQELREVTINGTTATVRPRSVFGAEVAAIGQMTKAESAVESGTLDPVLVKERTDALKAFSINPSQQTWDTACNAQERLLGAVNSKGTKNKAAVAALRVAYREVMKDPFALVSRQ